MKNKRAYFLWGGCVFLFFMVWFTRIHPILIADTDDWGGSLYKYNVIPEFNAFEPTKVLPHVLQPLVSRISVYGFSLLLGGDVFLSLTVGYAFIVSAAISILMVLIYAYFVTKTNGYNAVLICILYFLSTFWIFRVNESALNYYMYKTVDSTTYFHYVIPNILNCILVLLLQKENTTKSAAKNAFLIILAYMCMFSNILCSVIFSAYYAGEVVTELMKGTIRKRGLIRYVRESIEKIIISIVWFLTLYMESHGGRSKDIGKDLTQCLKESLDNLLWRAQNTNKSFVIFTLVIVLTGIIISFSNAENIRGIAKYGCAIALMIIYDVLVCAKANVAYIKRADVLYGVFFFYMMIVSICLFSILEKSLFAQSFVPLLLLCILFSIDTNGKTFLEAYPAASEPESVSAISRDIIEQVVSAEQSQLENVTIYVPDYENDSNWPYATKGAADRFSSFAYEFGLTKSKVEITEVVPTKEKNYLRY